MDALRCWPTWWIDGFGQFPTGLFEDMQGVRHPPSASGSPRCSESRNRSDLEIPGTKDHLEISRDFPEKLSTDRYRTWVGHQRPAWLSGAAFARALSSYICALGCSGHGVSPTG